MSNSESIRSHFADGLFVDHAQESDGWKFLHNARGSTRNVILLIVDAQNDEALTYLQSKLKKLNKILRNFNFPSLQQR